MARQSVGSATGVAVGVGLEDDAGVGSGEGVPDAEPLAEGGVLGSGDVDPHAVSVAASDSRATAITTRAFMGTRYCSRADRTARIAVRRRRSWRGTLGG